MQKIVTKRSERKNIFCLGCDYFLNQIRGKIMLTCNLDKVLLTAKMDTKECSGSEHFAYFNMILLE